MRSACWSTSWLIASLRRSTRWLQTEARSCNQSGLMLRRLLPDSAIRREMSWVCIRSEAKSKQDFKRYNSIRREPATAGSADKEARQITNRRTRASSKEGCEALTDSTATTAQSSAFRLLSHKSRKLKLEL